MNLPSSQSAESGLCCGPFCGCGHRLSQWLRGLCISTSPEDISLVSAAIGPKRSLLKSSSGTSTQASHKSRNQVDIESFEQEALRAHNAYRKQHGTPELKLNAELCKYARDWAFMLIQLDRFTSRSNCLYGENLFVSYRAETDVKMIARDACQAWYSELYNYEYDREPRSSVAASFTQMIWNNTKELGIGMAKSCNKVIVVANYNPKGNLRGDYAANCPRPVQ